MLEVKRLSYLISVESSEIVQIVGNNDVTLVNTALV
jgi:hypothetical protein